MGRLSLIPVAALAGLAAPVCAKDARMVLEPITQWNVDFGEEKCRLARVFGDAKNKHLLFIEQGGPETNFVLVAAGPAFERFRRPNRISIQFGAFPPIEKPAPMLGNMEDGAATLIYSRLNFQERPNSEPDAEESEVLDSLAKIDTESASKIDAIRMHYGKRTVVFNTGNIGEAIKVMNECALNFVESWGLDRAAHESMTRLPEWTNMKAIAREIQESYPSEALRKGESGIFRLRVIVEADGSVSDCIINNATTTDSLQSPACSEMKRAEFKPALDKNGAPMRSFYVTNVTYRLN